MSVVASAPGKIVLAGEYAVLWGAPAISMAVNRRALATVSPNDVGECRLATPGFDGDGGFRIVDTVANDGRPACDLELDSTAFVEDGKKTGIGSSAALTVALLAATQETTDVYAAALAAHSRLQGGAGSGVDVASAVHGGLIEYECTNRSVRRLSWPRDLLFRVIWSGVPASTTERVEQLANRTTKASRSALLLAAPRIRDAWVAGDADAILAEYVGYIGVLRQFSVDHDLGIFDAGHDELTDAAMADGLVYKPAGAGGGDIGILFGRDTADLDAFLQHRADMIHGVLSCELEPDGVRLESR
jgi:phosphomevalonate kinase